MRVFAISDLHLSFMVEKPMDIFGGNWQNHTEKLKANWQNTIAPDDLVLIGGDISWAMKIEETKLDFDFIESLNGQKVIIKGNHEYWWKSISGVRSILPPSVFALQNDSIKIGSYVIAGTRGWDIKENENDPSFTADDQRIYDREVIRIKLALDDALKKRQEGDKLIFMIHYPPFNSKREENEMTRLFEEYKVDKVIFGHLHKTAGRFPYTYSKNGIDYYLTSADLISMQPIQLY